MNQLDKRLYYPEWSGWTKLYIISNGLADIGAVSSDLRRKNIIPSQMNWPEGTLSHSKWTSQTEPYTIPYGLARRQIVSFQMDWLDKALYHQKWTGRYIRRTIPHELAGKNVDHPRWTG
jgi:hypothetical protein